MSISPRRLQGNWDIGYALDIHTVSSEYIGDNQYGYPQYETIRSDLGELLYQIKYMHDYSKIQVITRLIENFVLEHFMNKVDWVLPIPPTKKRRIQHVEVIAKNVSKILHCGYSDAILVNKSVGEAKNNNGQRQIIQVRAASSRRNILLVDDITNTGSTARTCVDVLRTDPNINKVYFLTLTIRRTASWR